MNKFTKILTLALSLVLMTLLVSCNNATSMSIQEHYENNRYIYEELAEETGGDGATINFTVRDSSLVLTATIPLSIKKGQEDTFGRIVENNIKYSDDVYYEVLKNIREDVPDATFIVEFVDKNNVPLASKEYK